MKVTRFLPSQGISNLNLEESELMQELRHNYESSDYGCGGGLAYVKIQYTSGGWLNMAIPVKVWNRMLLELEA